MASDYVAPEAARGEEARTTTAHDLWSSATSTFNGMCLRRHLFRAALRSAYVSRAVSRISSLPSRFIHRQDLKERPAKFCYLVSSPSVDAQRAGETSIRKTSSS